MNQEARYTRTEAAFLTKCPVNLPGEYMKAKREHSPQETEGQERINFQDLMELRVWTLISHVDNKSWRLVRKMAARQAGKLLTPYPMCDPRTAEELRKPPERNGLRDRHGLGMEPQKERLFQEMLAALFAAVEFEGNSPARWLAGTDMNIAVKGAEIALDPRVNSGQPTIADTRITTGAAHGLIQTNGGDASEAARYLGISQEQAETADTYELSLRLHRPTATQGTGDTTSLPQEDQQGPGSTCSG